MLGRSRLLLVLVAGAALTGLLVGITMDDERRGRASKLLCEAREMPFRLFV